MSNDKEIKDGFNAGYILKTKSPETYKILIENLKDVELPFFKGFVEAGLEVQQDLEKDKGTDLEIDL